MSGRLKNVDDVDCFHIRFKRNIGPEHRHRSCQACANLIFSKNNGRVTGIVKESEVECMSLSQGMDT